MPHFFSKLYWIEGLLFLSFLEFAPVAFAVFHYEELKNISQKGRVIGIVYGYCSHGQAFSPLRNGRYI